MNEGEFMKIVLPNQQQLKKIKMIVCDLDETLFDHQKTIPQQTTQYLIELQKKGYILVLATGRFYYELQSYIEQLQLKKYHGYVVCVNGLEIYDLTHQKKKTYTKLDYDETKQFIQKANQYNIISYLNYNQKYHVFSNTLIRIIGKMTQHLMIPFYPIIKKNHRLKGFMELSFDKTLPQNITAVSKICFLAKIKTLKEFCQDIITDNFPYVFYDVNPNVVELTHESVGKLQAIISICQQRHFSLEQVLAFGDSGNDKDLLSRVGIGVAMKNAYPHVLASTPYRTIHTNNEEGVYHYLKDIIKI